MEKKKRIVVSKCCKSKVHFIPPSLGEPGIYFCSVCSKFCETEIKEVLIEIKKYKQ